MHNSWYIVVCKARQELRAKENLENQGGMVFYPEITVNTIKAGRQTQQTEALFPGYVFLSIEKNPNLMHKIRSTLGVQKLLNFNGTPATVSPLLIDDIKHRLQQQEHTPLFKAGDSVNISHGPLQHYQAIFKQFKGRDRAIILLDLLGQQNELLIELKHLK